MESAIKTALCSFGMSGQVFHGPLLKVDPNYEVVKVLERTHHRSGKLFPDAQVVTDLAPLLTEEVALVVVNTPDHLHYPMAKAALEAGKHVVIEKPFTIRSAEGEELIALAKAKGCLLTVFQNRRWDGDFLTVQKLLESGLLGEVVEVESHFDRFRNYIPQGTWKEDAELGTGNLYNLGSHLIDQAVVLFGAPESVWCDMGATRQDSKVTDYFHLILKYPSVRFILKSGYLVKQPGPRFAVQGSQGSFVKHGLDPQEDTMKAGQLPEGGQWGQEPESEWGSLQTSVNGLELKGKIETLAGDYRIFYNKLHKSIKKGGELPVRAEDSLLGLKIIEAAIESHEKRRWIDLPLKSSG